MADHDPTADLTDAERAVMDFDESTLTDEEAHALNAQETAAAPVPAPAPADDGAAAVTDDGKPATDPADAAAAAAPEAAPAAVATPALAAEPAAAPAPQPDPVAQAQIPVIAPPADAKERLEKIATDKAEAARQFDDGEITARQYQATLDTLNDDKLQIDLAVNNAALSAQMAAAAGKAAWDAQCNRFFAEPAAEIYKDANTFEVFNDNVKAMAMMPRNRGLTERQLLDKVDQVTRAELGLPARAAAHTPAPAPQAAPKPPAPKAFPPTIGTMPAADTTDTTGGQYAHLDRLQSSDPIAYEEAFSKLSEAQQNAYLKAG